MEIWKDVIGYEGLYRVSNYGKVNSLNYGNHGFSKLLTPKKNNKGYLWIELRKNGKPKQFLLHRLVAGHFIENPYGYPIINHKDENPLNNHADNLEWCDNSYNVTYFLARHTRKQRNGCRSGVAYRTFDKVAQYDMNGNLIKIWDSCVQIKHVWGKNEHSVRECCLGKRKTAYGFKWAFARENTPQETAV
jgi:hypothetical protein